MAITATAKDPKYVTRNAQAVKADYCYDCGQPFLIDEAVYILESDQRNRCQSCARLANHRAELKVALARIEELEAIPCCISHTGLSFTRCPVHGSVHR